MKIKRSSKPLRSNSSPKSNSRCLVNGHFVVQYKSYIGTIGKLPLTVNGSVMLTEKRQRRLPFSFFLNRTVTLVIQGGTMAKFWALHHYSQCMGKNRRKDT